MMNRISKYLICLLALFFVGYNSVYFRKLSELKAAEKSFDAVSYAQDLVDHQLEPVLKKALFFDTAITELSKSPAQVFRKHGRSLTIGTAKFFMVQGTGKIVATDESGVEVLTDHHHQLKIATEYIFGNGIRDATGLVNLNDFSNTNDLSNISSEINRIVRKKVIPPFLKSAKTGDQILFAGAIGLNEAHLDLKNIELLPISLKIVR